MSLLLSGAEQPAGDADAPDLVDIAKRIAREVAAVHADDVDAAGRFPAETMAALREQGVMSALVPGVFSEQGVSITDMARAIEHIGSACSTSGMILAMHQIQVVCLLQQQRTTPWLQQFVREVVVPGGLLASVTSEVGIGGDARSSRCSVVDHGTHLVIDKEASVISYGEQADAYLITARRTVDASSGDQVLAVVPAGPDVLTRTSTWDALGMRGTCSHGFVFHGELQPEQVLPEGFGVVFARSMLPSSHVFWTSLWLGMATSAMRTARSYIRAQARKSNGTLPTGAARLAHTVAQLDAMRAMVRGAAIDYDRRLALPPDEAGFDTLGYGIKVNNLKLQCSQMLNEIVHQALLVCGVAGYSQRSPYSLGRTLRDSLGALVQINNERITGANAQSLLLSSGGIDEDV